MTKNFLIYSQLEAEAKSENTPGDRALKDTASHKASRRHRLGELAQKDDNLALIVAQNTIASAKLLKELNKSNNSVIDIFLLHISLVLLSSH